MKYLVLKIDDIRKYCTPYGVELIQQGAMQIRLGRLEDGKEPNNQYLVVNTDEHYANEIKEIIEKHEGEKVTFD